MGREANCTCEWKGAVARVKALLEPPELILRGEVRCKIPFAEMKRVVAAGDTVQFSFRGETVRLVVGKDASAKWVKAIRTPPPSLAKKLGIEAGALVRVIGKVDDAGLEFALVEAKKVTRGKANVVVARVTTAAELRSAFEKAGDLVADGAALWIVYRKGSGQAVGESDVRATGLEAGVVDVKVASVSAELTGLKFVRRKSV